jgi:hypothetical protein
LNISYKVNVIGKVWHCYVDGTIGTFLPPDCFIKTNAIYQSLIVLTHALKTFAELTIVFCYRETCRKKGHSRDAIVGGSIILKCISNREFVGCEAYSIGSENWS